MMEAIFGLIGVLVGSGLTWLQAYSVERRARTKSARHLAIRLVCLFDKYLEDCADVVNDDGLSCGQRSPEGYLEPQVKSLGPPSLPDNVDWTSIDHELMYHILSFPAEVEAGDRMVAAILEIATPPDFTDWFEERRFYYSTFGLNAHYLSIELCRRYNIRRKSYNQWDPEEELKQMLEKASEQRRHRTRSYEHQLQESALRRF